MSLSKNFNYELNYTQLTDTPHLSMFFITSPEHFHFARAQIKKGTYLVFFFGPHS